MSSVLVVGATGILAPAAASLRERGLPVLGVARSGADLDADGTSSAFVSLLPASLAGALLYGPAVSSDSVLGVVARCDGPVVHVLTSASSDPTVALLPAPAGVRRLFLGWRVDRSWHTPEEVSAAALAVYDGALADGSVLGVVRPWSDKP